ncbi:hypothetical protein GGR53DRAFT_525955 [Hypoxylon sp. FL1150]|nr:hypothetical protein GGR53DRAFT_525955 [Hypoxylon sp. FL1150]
MEAVGDLKRKRTDDDVESSETAALPEAKRQKQEDKVDGRQREPHGSPEIWAEKRAALNDALPYFKAHQGSLYTKDLIPYGMLIDAEVGVRDHFSSQLIITSIGGGRVRDPKTGKMTRDKNQDVSMGDLRATMGSINGIIAVIAGAKNSGYPVRPPHYYCVLDHFVITDVWPEVMRNRKNETITYYKIRLQKAQLGTRSWFAPKGASPEEAGEYEVGKFTCQTFTCETCNKTSKHKFTKGWTCLQRDCQRYYAFDEPDNSNVKFEDLEYHENFLKERMAVDCTNLPPLKPPLPQRSAEDLGCETVYKQGIVCPKCGCCINRIKWTGWECLNPECSFELPMSIKTIGMDRIKEEEKALNKRNLFVHEGLLVHTEKIGGYTLVTHLVPVIPDGSEKVYIGVVSRLRPSEELRTRDGGYNDLYKEMQNEDIGLERRGAKNSGQRTEEVTSHFSANFGAPYKFGVVVKNSIAFEKSPKPIMDTLNRLTWAGKIAVEKAQELLKTVDHSTVEGTIPEDFVPFNEELVLGYFESSKIGAHDDGEKELGPTVASLSLGSPSIMKWLPKPPRKSRKKDNTDAPAEGPGAKTVNPKPILSMELRHGDIMVMHGAAIQKHYNHSVDPKGMHRFALTCRHIKKESITDLEQRKISEEDGRIPKPWQSVYYDGARDEYISKETGERTDLPGTSA